MLKFAVVDLETTGGHGEDNRIMEIGIALMDGSEIVETYHSLVDPGQPITPFVRELTGITDEMVMSSDCPGDSVHSSMGSALGFLPVPPPATIMVTGF